MLIRLYVTDFVVVVQRMPRFVIMVRPGVLLVENLYLRNMEIPQRRLDILRGVSTQYMWCVNFIVDYTVQSLFQLSDQRR